MRAMILLFGLLAGMPAAAEIQTKAVTYEHDGKTLTGHLYWDDVLDGPRPGVMVIHEWWGLNDYAKQRARMLAELGYVAFAADMYGGDRVTDKPDQAKEWMQEACPRTQQTSFSPYMQKPKPKCHDRAQV